MQSCLLKNKFAGILSAGSFHITFLGQELPFFFFFAKGSLTIKKNLKQNCVSFQTLTQLVLNHTDFKVKLHNYQLYNTEQIFSLHFNYS